MNEEFETSKDSTIQDLKRWIRAKKEPKKIEIFDFNNTEIHEQTSLEFLFNNDFLVNFDDLYCHVHISEDIDYNQIYTRFYDTTYRGIRFLIFLKKQNNSFILEKFMLTYIFYLLFH